MARYRLPVAVHVDADTPFGRAEADFPAGDVTAGDACEDALLAHVADVVAGVERLDLSPAAADVATPVPPVEAKPVGAPSDDSNHDQADPPAADPATEVAH